jgi:small-conductance mechanosensitive channel
VEFFYCQGDFLEGFLGANALVADIAPIINSLSSFNWLSIIPAIVIIILSFVAAKVVYFLLKNVVRRMASRTKTVLDDLLLEAIETPILFGVMLAGLFFASLVSGLGDIPIVIALFKSLLIGWLSISAYRIVAALLRWYAVEVGPAHDRPLGDLEHLFRRLAGLFIGSLGLILVLDTLGIQVNALLASLGIAGLAVALAFQDTLGNFFAGIYLSLDRPLKPGDYIELESGQSGYVRKIGWRSTSLLQLSNNLTVIPNSKLASAIITNYYSPDMQISVRVPVSVSYDSDLQEVERITLEVAREIQNKAEGAVKDFEPSVRFTKFEDSGISLLVILRVNEFKYQYLVVHAFIKALHARYKKEGIEIPYPKRSVYIEKFNASAKRASGRKYFRAKMAR